MGDITAPVIAIALILAAVFVPVGFIPGMVGNVSTICHHDRYPLCCLHLLHFR
jgi:hypothetical protein